jgi:hypothetical protein
MRSRIGSGRDQEYVVALLFVISFELRGSIHFTNIIFLCSLNIPANNCAILQRGDDLELLPAGQHYITNPNVTLRGLYTLGENQLEMPTKDM